MTEATFRVVWRAQHPVDTAAVTIRLSPEYNRRLRPEDPTDDAVLQLWEERRARAPNVVLFNGTKFRLHSVITSGAKVELQLGITDYRSLCGTNFLHSSQADDAIAIDDPANAANSQYMSHALGVEALVLSSDGYVVMFRRSDRVMENPGWYCCPGGHAEPCHAFAATKASPATVAAGDGASVVSEAMVQAERTFPASAADHHFSRFHDEDATHSPHATPTVAAQALYDLLAEAVDPAAVLAELFTAPIDEVVEELGVPREAVTCEGLIAIVEASNNYWKPDAIFRIRVALSGDEIRQIHSSGVALESFESAGPVLLLLPADIVAGRLPKDAFIAPPSLACLQLAL
jgi:hypothetical protein